MPNTIKYQYRRTVALTKKEGEQVEELLKKEGVKNVSQLVKKILRSEEKC